MSLGGGIQLLLSEPSVVGTHSPIWFPGPPHLPGGWGGVRGQKGLGLLDRG